jgi:hypothetical protein
MELWAQMGGCSSLGGGQPGVAGIDLGKDVLNFFLHKYSIPQTRLQVHYM